MPQLEEQYYKVKNPQGYFDVFEKATKTRTVAGGSGGSGGTGSTGLATGVTGSNGSTGSTGATGTKIEIQV